MVLELRISSLPLKKIVRDVKETAGVADGKLDFGVVVGGSCSAIRVSLCAIN